MSEEQKLRTLKRTEKKKKNYKAFIINNIRNIIIGIIVIIVLFVAYWLSPLAKVSKIDVSGLNDLGEQQVINSSKITSDTSVLDVLFNKKNYENTVKSDLQTIRTITFNFHSFNQLSIKAKEYETVGFVLKDGYYYPILETGKIVTKKSKLPIGNYPVYSNFKNKKVLDNTIKHYAKFSTKIKNSISEVKYEPSDVNDYKVRLYMNDGNETIVDTRTMVKKMIFYPSITSQMKKHGVVDLEVGSYSYPFSANNGKK